MSRFILIDNSSGYIWGDSADLDGKIFSGTPMEFAAALDAHIGVHGRTYEEVGHHALASNETGYHAYRADVGGSKAFPVVQDGQDREMIAAALDCEYVTTIRCLSGTE
jgi:hypothetical protein